MNKILQPHPHQLVDDAALEARFNRAIWHCNTCGTDVDPVLMPVMPGLTLVVQIRCPECGQPAPGQRDDVATLRLAAERRDKERADRYFSLPGTAGLHPSMPAWQYRFFAQTMEDDDGVLTGGTPFETDYHELAADTMAQVLAWVCQIRHARTAAYGAAAAQVQDHIDRGELPDLSPGDVEWRRALLADRLMLAALRPLPSCVLIGEPGSGKSHLALAAYHALIDGDIGVLYVSAPTFLATLQSYWGREDAGIHEHQLVTRLCSAQVLILDDVGREDIRPRTITLWGRIFRDREQRGLPSLVVTDNMALAATTLGPATCDLFSATLTLPATIAEHGMSRRHLHAQRAVVDPNRLAQQGADVLNRLHPVSSTWAAALGRAYETRRALPAPHRADTQFHPGSAAPHEADADAITPQFAADGTPDDSATAIPNDEPLPARRRVPGRIDTRHPGTPR